MNDLVLLIIVRHVVAVGKLGHHGRRDAVLQILQTRAAGRRQHLLRLHERLSRVLRNLRDNRRLLHALAAHNLTGLHDLVHLAALLLDQLWRLLLLLLNGDAGLGGGQTISGRRRGRLLLRPHVPDIVGGYAGHTWGADGTHQRDAIGGADGFLSARCSRLSDLDRHLGCAHHGLVRLLGQHYSLLGGQVGHHLGPDGDALRLLLLLQQVLDVCLIGRLHLDLEGELGFFMSLFEVKFWFVF
jgi:hypothetical protein